MHLCTFGSDFWSLPFGFGRDHITLQILTFCLNFIPAVVPRSAASSGRGSAQFSSLVPLPASPCCQEERTHATCRLPACRGWQLLRHCLLSTGVNVKLIPASRLSHTDLVNGNAFGFREWRSLDLDLHHQKQNAASSVCWCHRCMAK